MDPPQYLYQVLKSEYVGAIAAAYSYGSGSNDSTLLLNSLPPKSA